MLLWRGFGGGQRLLADQAGCERPCIFHASYSYGTRLSEQPLTRATNEPLHILGNAFLVLPFVTLVSNYPDTGIPSSAFPCEAMGAVNLISSLVQQVMSIRYAERTYVMSEECYLGFSLEYSGIEHDYII